MREVKTLNTKNMLESNYSQTSAEQGQTFEASAVVSCPQYECINENESISNYLDPKPVSVFSLQFWQKRFTEVVQ